MHERDVDCTPVEEHDDLGIHTVAEAHDRSVERGLHGERRRRRHAVNRCATGDEHDDGDGDRSRYRRSQHESSS